MKKFLSKALLLVICFCSLLFFPVISVSCAGEGAGNAGTSIEIVGGSWSDLTKLPTRFQVDPNHAMLRYYVIDTSTLPDGDGFQVFDTDSAGNRIPAADCSKVLSNSAIGSVRTPYVYVGLNYQRADVGVGDYITGSVDVPTSDTFDIGRFYVFDYDVRIDTSTLPNTLSGVDYYTPWMESNNSDKKYGAFINVGAKVVSGYGTTTGRDMHKFYPYAKAKELFKSLSTSRGEWDTSQHLLGSFFTSEDGLYDRISATPEAMAELLTTFFGVTDISEYNLEECVFIVEPLFVFTYWQPYAKQDIAIDIDTATVEELKEALVSNVEYGTSTIRFPFGITHTHSEPYTTIELLSANQYKLVEKYLRCQSICVSFQQIRDDVLAPFASAKAVDSDGDTINVFNDLRSCSAYLDLSEFIRVGVKRLAETHQLKLCGNDITEHIHNDVLSVSTVSEQKSRFRGSVNNSTNVGYICYGPLTHESQPMPNDAPSLSTVIRFEGAVGSDSGITNVYKRVVDKIGGRSGSISSSYEDVITWFGAGDNPKPLQGTWSSGSTAQEVFGVPTETDMSNYVLYKANVGATQIRYFNKTEDYVGTELYDDAVSKLHLTHKFNYLDGASFNVTWKELKPSDLGISGVNSSDVFGTAYGISAVNGNSELHFLQDDFRSSLSQELVNSDGGTIKDKNGVALKAVPDDARIRKVSSEAIYNAIYPEDSFNKQVLAGFEKGNALSSAKSNDTSADLEINLGHDILFYGKADKVTSKVYEVSTSTGAVTSETDIVYPTNLYGSYTPAVSSANFVALAVYESEKLGNVDTIAGSVYGLTTDKKEEIISVLNSAPGLLHCYESIPTKLLLGSTDVENGAKKASGYTVVSVYTVTPTPSIPPEADYVPIELKSFMLNDYTDNVINAESSRNDAPIEYYLTPNQSSISSSIMRTCSFSGDCKHKYGCRSWSFPYLAAYDFNWTVDYKDVSSGTITQRDAGGFLGTYLLTGTGSWSKVVRKDFTVEENDRFRVKQNTKNLSSYACKVDYAYNFIRSGVYDVRTVSALSHMSGSYPAMLDVAYGVKPTVVLEATEKRDAYAFIRHMFYTDETGRSAEVSGCESFVFRSVYNQTNNVWGHYWCGVDRCTKQTEPCVDRITGVTTWEGSGPHDRTNHSGSHSWYCDGHVKSCGSQHSITTYYPCPGHGTDADGKPIPCTTSHSTITYFPCPGHLYPCDTGHSASHSCSDPIGYPAYHPSIGNHVQYVCGYYDKYGNGGSGAVVSAYIGIKAYKYSSDILPTGKNIVAGLEGKHLSTSSMSKAARKGNVTPENGYRIAYVQRNDGNNGTSSVTLGYYPEVPMIYITQSSDVFKRSEYSISKWQTLRTVGEYKRTTQSSTLYLYRLNAINGDNAVGVVYSDSMQGGAAIQGSHSGSLGNVPIIPAGADVSLVATPKGLKLDLYGYALDLINPTYDTALELSGQTYSNIIPSGVNAYSAWNNVGSHDNLFKNFETWWREMTNVDNYHADIKLQVKNTVNGRTKEYNDFGTTIGAINSVTPREDGTFQLTVKNGQLITSGEGSQGYQKMIEQITKDYGVSTSVAKRIFEESGIYQTILNSIEHNKSVADGEGCVVTNCSANPGSYARYFNRSDKWYDEEVKTFVIRRFVSENNKFGAITLADKIDFGVAANSPSGNAIQSYNEGRWFLSLYYTNKMNTIAPAYNPKSTATISTALLNFSMICNDVTITGSDFYIPSSSTADFGN